MGAPRGSTTAAFNVHRPGREIEGDPKSVKSANKKGKGKNGGSNDTSPGSAKPNSLLPPDTGSHRGNRSRTLSVSNTPTSSSQTSPKTEKENLSRVAVGDNSRGVKGGSTDSENRERSSKQSINASSRTSPPKPQPSSLQESFPPQSRKPIPQPTGEPSTSTALHGKQEKVKTAALPTFDLPTPPASPETQYQTVPAALKGGPAASLLGSPSGLADMDKQDNVKSAALLSSSPLTPPASPRTQNLAVQADLDNGPASSNSPPENASGLAELKDKQDDVKPVARIPSSDSPTTPTSPAVPADLEDGPAFSARNCKRLARQGHQDDVKSAVLPSS